MRVILGQQLSEFLSLNRGSSPTDDVFFSGGAGLNFGSTRRVEILGPDLDRPLRIDSAPDFDGSALVSADSLESELIGTVEFHPTYSNSSPEVAERVLSRVISQLSDGACVMVSNDAFEDTDATEQMPTVEELETALTSGWFWWRSWDYRCGGVSAVVAIEKSPVSNPHRADGFYIRIYLQRFAEWERRMNEREDKARSLIPN
ncbi:hypothetical protein [Peristeroidobacter soli]|uniref:hypothetical protein n=1 Tax=Peristeroidobacter soli TaxID=2497877 RepID=UPI00101C6353|nr:hypothetical protein [Peristeroidobacter soli]